MIEENGRYGFINREGKAVVYPQYGMAYDFTEGLAPVQIGGKWGFINSKGEMAIAPDTVYGYGCIDKSGNFIWNPREYKK